jgi:hypothetical protein
LQVNAPARRQESSNDEPSLQLEKRGPAIDNQKDYGVLRGKSPANTSVQKRSSTEALKARRDWNDQGGVHCGKRGQKSVAAAEPCWHNEPVAFQTAVIMYR